MANTGYIQYLNLIEVDSATGLPTGNTKPNVPGDPDYVFPRLDVVLCPTEAPPGVITVPCGQIVQAIGGGVYTTTHEGNGSGQYVLSYNSGTLVDTVRVYYLNGGSEVNLYQGTLSGSGERSFYYDSTIFGDLYVEYTGSNSASMLVYSLECPSIVIAPPIVSTVDYPEHLCLTTTSADAAIAGQFRYLDVGGTYPIYTKATAIGIDFYMYSLGYDEVTNQWVLTVAQGGSNPIEKGRMAANTLEAELFGLTGLMPGTLHTITSGRC